MDGKYLGKKENFIIYKFIVKGHFRQEKKFHNPWSRNIDMHGPDLSQQKIQACLKKLWPGKS
jgi:hypothetical protein